MGQSSDAIMIWGIDFGDFDENPPYPFDCRGMEDDAIWEYIKENNLIEHVVHCHCDYRMHIIGLRSTYQRASRGDPVEMEVRPSVSDPTPIKKFCEKFGLEYETPVWILCSMFG